MKRNVRRGPPIYDVRVKPTDVSVLFNVEIWDRGTLLWKGELWDRDIDGLYRDVMKHTEFFLKWGGKQ